MSGIVIIGAGQAGSSLAIKLRTLGYEGAVTLIGEEPYAPYQRPPLSILMPCVQPLSAAAMC